MIYRGRNRTFWPSVPAFLFVLVQALELVVILCRYVALDLQDLGDGAFAGLALQLNHHVERFSDVLPDHPVRQINAGHEDTGGEAGDGLGSGVCVNGAQASGMAGIERLEQVKSLPASHFTHDDSVGPESQGGFQKLPDGNRRDSLLLAACLQPDQVIFLDLNFRGVFDEDDALFRSDEVREGIEERGFAGSAWARD